MASALLGRFLETLLYGVVPDDPLTYIGVPVVLFVVAAMACFAPTCRAARLDPLRALRSELALSTSLHYNVLQKSPCRNS